MPEHKQDYFSDQNISASHQRGRRHFADLLKAVGPKHGGKVVKGHAVLSMVLGDLRQEATEVLEEAVVGLWQFSY